MKDFQLYDEERLTAMEIAILLRKKDDEKLAEMDAYIESLRKAPDNQAKEDAIKALKRTGVLNSKGTVKRKIVSWE